MKCFLHVLCKTPRARAANEVNEEPAKKKKKKKKPLKLIRLLLQRRFVIVAWPDVKQQEYSELDDIHCNEVYADAERTDSAEMDKWTFEMLVTIFPLLNKHCDTTYLFTYSVQVTCITLHSRKLLHSAQPLCVQCMIKY